MCLETINMKEENLSLSKKISCHARPVTSDYSANYVYKCNTGIFVPLISFPLLLFCIGSLLKSVQQIIEKGFYP